MKRRAVSRRNPAFAWLGPKRQRGQAMVEYLVGTLFVVMAVSFLANPTLFNATSDVLQAVKDYFRAFAYAMSVAGT